MLRALLPVSERRFWEGQARDYPLPFEKETSERSLPVLDILEGNGIVIKGKSILDIGCGTGVFALPLALRGARVTALDISETMLLRLRQEAQRHGPMALSTALSGWRDLDIEAGGFKRAFDVAFCGFSTAVESEEDIVKMEQCAKQWCVYVASGKVQRARLCRQMLRAVRAPLNPRPDIRTIRKRLAGMGRQAQYAGFKKTVIQQKTQAEIIQFVTTRLAAAGRKADPDRVASCVRLLWEKQSEASGYITCRSETEMGVLLWRVNEN